MVLFNHVKWPNFNNIHTSIHRCLEDIPVVVTEKIDGSNFGI